MNISTVNELIASLESAGELSIKERKYLDVMRWAVRVAGERDAALNAERVWERAMMEVCGEDGPASVASEIRALQALRDTAMQALKSQVEQLAAENVGLEGRALLAERALGHTQTLLATEKQRVNEYCGKLNIKDGILDAARASLSDYSSRLTKLEVENAALRKTPATDRIVAGIKADGRAEGINFAASRLAAAFNHGFVDKPMAEVFDVVRMILTAKEDLANDPAEDGLSGEYAEKSLAEWGFELREGADK
ncbi:hypothetical protein LM902_002242 [Klebsiella oxytoca]|nr:hypothetical protein [Klebsiella oxytoca]